jgi:hypothetical protein
MTKSFIKADWLFRLRREIANFRNRVSPVQMELRAGMEKPGFSFPFNPEEPADLA